MTHLTSAFPCPPVNNGCIYDYCAGEGANVHHSAHMVYREGSSVSFLHAQEANWTFMKCDEGKSEMTKRVRWCVGKGGVKCNTGQSKQWQHFSKCSRDNTILTHTGAVSCRPFPRSVGAGWPVSQAPCALSGRGMTLRTRSYLNNQRS